MDPLRAADELGDVAPCPGQSFGDLHTARAASNDTPALALIWHAMVPARRVEGRAGKALPPGNVGKERLVQKAGSANKNIGNVGVAVRRLDTPAAIGKTRGDDFLVEANEFGEAAVAGDLLDIRPDLGGRCIFT